MSSGVLQARKIPVQHHSLPGFINSAVGDARGAASSSGNEVSDVSVFKGILEGLSQGVLVFDGNIQLSTWNSHASLLLSFPDGFLRAGMSAEEIARFHASHKDYGGGDAEIGLGNIVDATKARANYRFEGATSNSTVLQFTGCPIPGNGFLLTVVDITEQRHAETALKMVCEELEPQAGKQTRELRESQERFRQMLDSSSDWYWETDENHRFTYISDKFYKISGYCPAEVVGRTRWDLVPDGDTVFYKLRKDLEARRPFRNVDYVSRVGDGSEMIVRTSGQPFYSDTGRFLGYRGTATDATSAIAAQKELLRSEKLAALGSLVAGIAHEINTPIGIGLTAATYLDEKTKNFLARISRNELRKSDLDTYVSLVSEISASLTTNLRRAALLVKSFKQVAVDQSLDKNRHFDLGGYIQEVLTSLAPRLKRTRHVVTVDCPPKMEIFCNPGAISQILTNLIVNSLTHGFEHKECGTISIRASREGSTLFIVYEDDGKGVPPENLCNIFQPFFTTKRGQGGSGLGLHIIYNLITQRMGGRLDFHSSDSKGVRFSICLPCVAPAEGTGGGGS